MGEPVCIWREFGDDRNRRVFGMKQELKNETLSASDSIVDVSDIIRRLAGNSDLQDLVRGTFL
jgi:hypothetical protein